MPVDHLNGRESSRTGLRARCTSLRRPAPEAALSRTPLLLCAAPIGNFLDDIAGSVLEAVRSTTHVFVEYETVLHAKLRERGVLTDDHVVRALHERSNPEAIALLDAGTPIVVLANTGLPCFVDPGWDIVRWALDHLDRVEPIPLGVASAVDAALVLSGLEVRQFLFLGHYPTTHTFAADLMKAQVPVIHYVLGPEIRAYLDAAKAHSGRLARILVLQNVRRRTAPRIWVLDGPDCAAPDELVGDRRDNFTVVLIPEGTTYRRR